MEKHESFIIRVQVSELKHTWSIDNEIPVIMHKRKLLTATLFQNQIKFDTTNYKMF